jgi:hypothetical protein
MGRRLIDIQIQCTAEVNRCRVTPSRICHGGALDNPIETGRKEARIDF